MKTLNKTAFVLASGYCVHSLAENSRLLSGLHYFPVNTLLFVHMYQITLALHILKLNRPLKTRQLRSKCWEHMLPAENKDSWVNSVTLKE